MLVLRLMPGGDLAFYRKATKGLQLDVVRFYMASVVLGLEALHAAGYVYRDLKDHNVLLDASGQARISDFGLVRLVRLPC